MFNIEQAVEQIIHSENPQNTFNKIAETLDDNWRTTLAREVNKHLFIENLANSDINQSIEFDVVETPTLTKQASEESVNTSKSSFLEKVAFLMPLFTLCSKNLFVGLSVTRNLFKEL